MNSTTRFILSISPACLAVGLTLIPAQAFSVRETLDPIIETSTHDSEQGLLGRMASDHSRGTWEGKGRIVKGRGQGGVVQLALTFNGQKVWTTRGPSLNRSTQKLAGITIKDRGRIWTFQRCGSRLCVSLQHNSARQVVRYLLYRQ